MEDDHKTKKDFKNFLSCTGLIRQDAMKRLAELKSQILKSPGSPGFKKR